jgi:hypothetical protein
MSHRHHQCTKNVLDSKRKPDALIRQFVNFSISENVRKRDQEAKLKDLLKFFRGIPNARVKRNGKQAKGD